MKPILSYKAVPLPLTPAFNTSICQCKVSVNQYRNWKSKKELTDYIDSLGQASGTNALIAIYCQCGRSYVYTTEDEIPAKSTTCTCGRKLIIYG